MKLMRWRSLTCVLAIVLCLVACDNAPSGVIGSSKMEKLLADLYVADAMVNSHPEQFPTDSDRVAVRRSVFEKYGVTQRDYDSSIIWYAQNIDDYQRVMQGVVKRLKQRQVQNQADLAAAPPTPAGAAPAGAHKRYDATGDTANVWNLATTWQFLPTARQAYLPFEFQVAKDAHPGDAYALDLKLLSLGTQFTIFLAADYADGTTTFVSRKAAFDGWINVPLQCDRNASVRRVYGYVRYQLQPFGVAYADSIQLLRTRFDAAKYDPAIHSQVTLSRNKQASPPAPAKPVAAPASKPSAPPVQRGHFKPKQGVNKSGTMRPATIQP